MPTSIKAINYFTIKHCNFLFGKLVSYLSNNNVKIALKTCNMFNQNNKL